jgi:hypothetical protein
MRPFYVRSRWDTVGYIGYSLPLSLLPFLFGQQKETLAYYRMHDRCLDLRDMI